MVQGIVDRLGWNIGDTIEIGFIKEARCILLRSVSATDGFKLKFSNAAKRTGGRVYCIAFLRNYLATIVALPKKNILPVFLQGSDWQLAIPLDPIKWETLEFSKAGSGDVPNDVVGVYELLGSGDAVLRVGEGKIRERINAHLKDSRFSPPTVKGFRYLAVSDSADGKILEKIRIHEYESETGVLPRFQEIRA